MHQTAGTTVPGGYIDYDDTVSRKKGQKNKTHNLNDEKLMSEPDKGLLGPLLSSTLSSTLVLSWPREGTGHLEF